MTVEKPARVEINRDAGGRWRWQYSDRDTRLDGNETFAHREEAIRTASIAYPDVPQYEGGVRLGRPPPTGPSAPAPAAPGGRGARPASGGLLRIVCGAVGIALGVAVWRRRGKAARDESK